MADERVKMPGADPLTDYERGYLDGMWECDGSTVEYAKVSA